MTRLIFASHNQHKIKEINDILSTSKMSFIPVILGLDSLGFSAEIPETANTIEGNARQKAQYIYARFKVNCFAEDTGLEITALAGEPGVKSARYAGESRNSDDNIDLVLTKMKGKTDRTARFKTVMALYFNDQLFIFEGTCEGEITKERRGSAGFGYDPIFKPNHSQMTFGEMNNSEKNKISHRLKALLKMLEFLATVEKTH